MGMEPKMFSLTSLPFFFSNFNHWTWKNWIIFSSTVISSNACLGWRMGGDRSIYTKNLLLYICGYYQSSPNTQRDAEDWSFHYCLGLVNNGRDNRETISEGAFNKLYRDVAVRDFQDTLDTTANEGKITIVGGVIAGTLGIILMLPATVILPPSILTHFKKKHSRSKKPDGSAWNAGTVLNNS